MDNLLQIYLFVFASTLMQGGPGVVEAASISSDFYPHGTAQGDLLLQHSTGNSNSSSQTLQLQEGIQFYGNIYSAITVRYESYLAM